MLKYMIYDDENEREPFYYIERIALSLNKKLQFYAKASFSTLLNLLGYTDVLLTHAHLERETDEDQEEVS